MGQIVDDILNRPFTLRTKEEQIKIVLDGKPKPGLIYPFISQGESSSELDTTDYDAKIWLTACDKRKTLYCWSCLLFQREAQSVWTDEGYDDYENFRKGIEEHSFTQEHINGLLQLQLFISQNITSKVATDINSSTAVVHRNELLLKCVLDFVCHIATHNPYPPKGTIDLQCHVSEACIEALELCKNYELDETCEKAINLVKTSDFLQDFVKALTLMVRTKIKEEIQNCNYVSLIVSEHSKIESNSKISVILRYLRDGKVRERCAGINSRQFKPPKFGESAITMSCISDVISDYEIREKLIALSCDGAVMSRTQLKNLIDHYNSVCDESSICTFFVPCYFHPFDVVVEQTLCYEKKCDFVFKTVNSMKTYFRKNRTIRNAFCNFMTDPAKLPNLYNCSNWDFAHSLKWNRRQFINFFKSIVDNHEHWAVEDFTKALGYSSMLEEFDMIFLLEVFSVLRPHVLSLSEFVKGYSPEKTFDRKQVEHFVASLKDIAENGFQNLWNISCAEIKRAPEGSNTVEEYSNTQIQNGVYETNKQLFESIIHNVIKQVKLRFSFAKKMSFMQLLNSEVHEKQLQITEVHTDMLMNTCGGNFNKNKLIKELKVLDSALGLPVEGLLEFVSADNTKNVFENVIRLAEMVLALPCSIASTSKPLSKVGNDLSQVNNDRALKSGGSSTKSDDYLFLKDVPCKEFTSCTFEVVGFWSTFVSEDDKFANEWSFFCIEQEVFQILCTQKGFYGEFLDIFRKLNALANELLSADQ